MNNVDDNLINYIDNKSYKFRDIYYNFKDYIKKHLDDNSKNINCLYDIKHIYNIYYSFIINIPNIINQFYLIIPNNLVIDELLEDLVKYLDNIYSVNNFLTFSYKMFVIKKAFDYEDQVFLFVDEFNKNIPQQIKIHCYDFYKNKDFNNFVNEWTLNIKNILPINFYIRELNNVFKLEDFANLMYLFNYEEYRSGVISLIDVITFIVYFKSILNNINNDIKSAINILEWNIK